MWYRISLIGGISAFVVSLLLLSRSIGFIVRSWQAVGVVARYDTITGGDAGTTYVPIFYITTSGGENIIYSHHSSSAPPSWDIGEKAMFLYDPWDHSSVRMYSYFGIFSWSIVLIALAILLLTFGAGYFSFRRYWL